MRRQLLALALVAATAAACSSAAASFPSISPIPTVPQPIPSLSPILQMPNVVGMRFREARDALRAKGLKVSRKEKYTSSSSADLVLSQSKKVGAIVAQGTDITLTVALAIPAAVNGNPWGYNFGCCKTISTPPSDFCSWFTCVATFYNGDGFVVQCDDLQYSNTGGSKTVCSSHEGFKRTLLDPSGV
jgi:PASTA domain